MSTPSIEIGQGDNRRIVFQLPEPPKNAGASVVALSLPKAGSVLLDRVLRDLAPHAHLSYVSMMEAFYNHGVSDEEIPSNASEVFLPKGYCFGGFRNIPEGLDIPLLQTSATVLLVRDPRDILVSHYFSMLGSHPQPTNSDGFKIKEGASIDLETWQLLAQSRPIDEYVLDASPVFLRFFSQYQHVCSKAEVRLFRYEDIIFAKHQWLRDISAHFGWTIADDILAEIATRHDLVPSVEDHTQHVRQVSPGDHTRKLKPQTIAMLNERFAEPMVYFGYGSLIDA